MNTPLMTIQNEKVIISSCKTSKWIRSSTENDRTEKCWNECRGGKCSLCDKNGNDGYCCRRDSRNINGLCSDEAILASSAFYHTCVYGKLNN